MDRPNVTDPGRLLAHRGASHAAPENTLGAFRTAKQQGVDWIEFDVSLLGDGTPVIHHDPTLDRCTNRSGPLSGIGADSLAALEAGPGEPLPTLDQTLDLLEETRMYANLEMKIHDRPTGQHATIVAEALKVRTWARDRVIISSFSVVELSVLRELMPTVPLAVVHRKPPPDWPEHVDRVRAAALHVHFSHLDHEILDTARDRGIDVRAFTVNEPALISPFRDHGLTGIITDHPPLYLDCPEWAGWLQR